MATGPALQITGSTLLADARYWAQDQDTTNPAVSAADGLARVNDRLVWWQANVESRPKTLASTTTGLSFAAGEMTKVVTTDKGILQILSAHPSSATTVSYPLAPRLKRISVEEIMRLHASETGGTVTARAASFECWAAEMDQNDQDDWRVFVYPAPTATLSLTIRATIPNILGLIGDTADISPEAARVLARIIGFDLAGVQKQNDAGYLSWVLAGVPREIQDKMFNQAQSMGAQQARPYDGGVVSN